MGEFNATAICEEFSRDVLPYLYGNATEEYRKGALVYGSILDLYYIIGFALFVLSKGKYLRLQPRNTFILFCAMASGILLTNIAIIGAEFGGRENLPCQARVWVYSGSLLLVGPGIVGTLMMYIYKLRLGRERMAKVMGAWRAPKTIIVPDTNQNQVSNAIGLPNSSSVNKIDQETTTKDKVSEYVCLLRDFFNVLKYSKDGRIVVSSDTISQSNDEEIAQKEDNKSEEGSATGTDNESLGTSSVALFNISDDGEKSIASTIRDKFLEKFGYPLLIIILLGFHIPIAIAIRIELDPTYKANCTGCPLTYVDYVMNMLGVGTYLFMVIVGVYAMRNEQDPLGIFYEIKIVIGFAVFPMIGWILLIADPGDLNKNYVFGWQYIHSFGHAGVYWAISYHQIFSAIYEERIIANRARDAARVSKIDNHTIAIITSENAKNKNGAKENYQASSLDVDRILNEPKARTALLEHAVDELSSENIVFLVKMRAWRAQYDRESAEKITKVAINIYNEFVKRDSRTPINIPSAVYSEVERAMIPYLISGKDTQPATVATSERVSKPPVTIFDSCEKECIGLIETDTLPRFVKSDIFKKRIVEDGVIKKILKR